MARLEESEQGVKVFFNAVRINNLPLVEKLLRKTPLLALEVNEKMQTVLHVAVRKKKLALMVQYLLDLDCSHILLKTKDITGKTPLEVAEASGHKEIIVKISEKMQMIKK